MIIATLKMMPLENKRQEALDVLRSVKGPVLADPGCLDCCIYEECDAERNIFFVQQWRSLAELERHLRSSSYVTILEAMELSSEIPVLCFIESGKTWGLDLVEHARGVARQ